jgi:hypothetical protein
MDPSDPNHAWISYSGFSAATPTEPGHVSSVNYDPNTGTATWTSLKENLGDMPVNDVVYDSNAGDIYIANDYGVLIDQSGEANSWQPAGPNMPELKLRD